MYRYFIIMADSHAGAPSICEPEVEMKRKAGKNLVVPPHFIRTLSNTLDLLSTE
jgi:hypothetical protein